MLPGSASLCQVFRQWGFYAECSICVKIHSETVCQFEQDRYISKGSCSYVCLCYFCCCFYFVFLPLLDSKNTQETHYKRWHAKVKSSNWNWDMLTTNKFNKQPDISDRLHLCLRCSDKNLLVNSDSLFTTRDHIGPLLSEHLSFNILSQRMLYKISVHKAFS